MQAKDTKKRILVFNVNWLGDVLFSTPVLRNIRFNYPDSFIACAVPARCLPVLEGNPHINEIIIFDDKGRHKGFFAKISFINLLKSRKFDIVFLLHRSWTRVLICWLAGIRQRIGYAIKLRGFLLTNKVRPLGFHDMHRVEYYLNIIEKSGLKIHDKFTEFFVSDADKAFVESFLVKNSITKDDFLVGLNPGGNWDLKRWPKEHWGRLIQELISKFGSKVIITGGEKDFQLANEIQVMAQSPVVISCGLSLKQSAALFNKLNVFISADSGPLHIASAVGVKNIIGLFGPTSPILTGPYPLENGAILSKDIKCQVPCYDLDCKDNRCMKAISVEDVIEQVSKLNKCITFDKRKV